MTLTPRLNPTFAQSRPPDKIPGAAIARLALAMYAAMASSQCFPYHRAFRSRLINLDYGLRKEAIKKRKI